MQNLINLSLSILLLTLLACTHKTDEIIVTPPEIILPQPGLSSYAVFEKKHLNHAWGHDYRHWIIDNEGLVRTIRNIDSVRVGKQSTVKSDLIAYTTEFDSVLFTIEKDTLSYYMSLIVEIENSIIDTIKHTRFDGGITSFDCYNVNGETYSNVHISGDTNYERTRNTHHSTSKVLNWLYRINEKIYW